MGGLISIGWIIWSGYARIKDMQPACYVDDTYHIVISNPESQPVFIRGINIKGNNIRSITKDEGFTTPDGYNPAGDKAIPHVIAKI